MKISDARYAAPIATGKPTTSATNERRASCGRRSTTATQKLASGPNSGPRTIAPMIRIGVSRKIPTAAISVDRTMKIMKLAVRVVDSEASSSTCSQTTAFAGSPGAARSAASAARESTHVELLDRDRSALGDAELLKIGEHDAGRLAGHVAEEHVALRRTAAPRSTDDVACARRLLEHTQHPLGQVGRDDDPQVDHAEAR